MHIGVVFTYEYWFRFTLRQRLWINSKNLSTSLKLSKPINQHSTVSSDMTLLVGHKKEHLACKNWVMRCLHGYPSGAECK